ncbi:50S ribosomal protein L3 [Gammaproteobacteria bacterium]|nr:50S ribosomal protein L3 [Gammaproteobacteria bacterium]
MLGLVGKKIGMTRIFSEDGRSTPVTVLHVDSNRVTQVRSTDKDGYRAVQVTAGSQKASRLNRAETGHYAKANVEPGVGLWEFRVGDDVSLDDFQPGSQVPVTLFEAGQSVDVRGRSIGKGFAGAMKRHNFRGGRATHGNSLSHRAPGSIGQNQSPGKVFKGKRMAGHMGDAMRTQQSLTIARVDEERQLLLVAGSVPGPKGQMVVVTPSAKAKTQ